MGAEARKHASTHFNKDEILSRFELSLRQVCGSQELRDIAPRPKALSD